MPLATVFVGVVLRKVIAMRIFACQHVEACLGLSARLAMLLLVDAWGNRCQMRQNER